MRNIKIRISWYCELFYVKFALQSEQSHIDLLFFIFFSFSYPCHEKRTLFQSTFGHLKQREKMKKSGCITERCAMLLSKLDF